jgi:ribonuclease-3
MEVAQKSGLITHITKNPSQGDQVPQGTAASTVEAVIGAVYLDCDKNMETVKKVLEAMNFYSNI